MIQTHRAWLSKKGNLILMIRLPRRSALLPFAPCGYPLPSVAKDLSITYILSHKTKKVNSFCNNS